MLLPLIGIHGVQSGAVNAVVHWDKHALRLNAHQLCKALSTLATIVAEFGNSRRIRWQIIAVSGDYSRRNRRLNNRRHSRQCGQDLSKQHPWNCFTQTPGVWTQVGYMYCIWRPPSNIRIGLSLTFLETTITGLHFAANNTNLSSLKFFWWAPEILFIAARETIQPSQVIDVGTSQKRVWDFLLVLNSNLGPILQRFGDFSRFYVLPTPPLFHPNFGGVPVSPDCPLILSRQLILAVGWTV